VIRFSSLIPFEDPFPSAPKQLQCLIAIHTSGPYSRFRHLPRGHGSSSARPLARRIKLPHALDVWPDGNGSARISSTRYSPGSSPPRVSRARSIVSASKAVSPRLIRNMVASKDARAAPMKKRDAWAGGVKQRTERAPNSTCASTSPDRAPSAGLRWPGWFNHGSTES
jgi:hypothetical protein